MELTGQGWLQAGELGLALLLSAAIGMERELHHKSAGLRTYTIVGFASALFVLVSKYGFSDVLAPGRISLDPSRVAAQIVSGIGFIGGGIIFVRRDTVQGITTAAGIWLTAAIGMAAGAGLPLLAIMATVAYFIVADGLRILAVRLRGPEENTSSLSLAYEDGRGILRDVLEHCTQQQFTISHVSTSRRAFEGADPDDAEIDPANRAAAVIDLRLTVVGRRPVITLVENLTSVSGILGVDIYSGSDEDE